jgi:hypothetical protein
MLVSRRKMSSMITMMAALNRSREEAMAGKAGKRQDKVSRSKAGLGLPPYSGALH